MRIEKIHLEGFATFRQGVTVEMASDGLNVIVGRNEAGKSTLLRGILAVLFGLENAAAIRRYRPWDGGAPFRGNLTVTDGRGRRLNIQRDFETQDVRVVQLKDGAREVLFEGVAAPRGRDRQSTFYLHFLRELLAIPDERMFRNTVFLAQQELQTPLGSELRKLLSGTSECDYQGALEGLRSRLAQLEGQGSKEARPATLLAEDELSNRRRRLNEGRRLLVRSLDGRRRVGELEERSEEVEDELSWLREEASMHERLLNLLRRLGQARTRYEEVLERQERASKLARKRDDLERTMRTRFSHFRQAPRNLMELLQAHVTETEERSRATTAHRQAAATLAAAKAPTGDTPILIIGTLCGLLAAGGLYLAQLGPALSLLNGAFLGVFALLAGRQVSAPGRRRHAALEHAVATTRQQVEVHKNRLEDIERVLGDITAGRSVREVQHEHRDLQRLRDERRRTLAALEGLGDGEAVNRAFDEAARELGSVEAALDELRLTSPEIGEITEMSDLETTVRQLGQRVEGLETERDEIRRELEERRVEVAGLEGRLERDLARLEDEVREGEENLEELRLETDALVLAADELEAAVRELEDGDLFKIGAEAGKLFAAVTNGRYDRVHLGAAMEPVVGRGDERPIRPEDLSQGAQDQLYFALRVAMARHLAPRASLPIFLDDTFVNYDRERLRITQKVLSRLEGHQLVFVSCDRAYTKWADHLIDLDQIRAATRPQKVQDEEAPEEREAVASS